MRIRTYTELVRLPTFEERFEYLKLGSGIGYETFGADRYLNQAFYNSKEWKRIRDQVFVRDLGRDLGIEGREISVEVVIHHMNPISLEDIIHSSEFLLNPEYLITTSLCTHNAIHFGSSASLPQVPKERRPYDTCPWRN